MFVFYEKSYRIGGVEGVCEGGWLCSSRLSITSLYKLLNKNVYLVRFFLKYKGCCKPWHLMFICPRDCLRSLVDSGEWRS